MCSVIYWHICVQCGVSWTEYILICLAIPTWLIIDCKAFNKRFKFQNLILLLWKANSRRKWKPMSSVVVWTGVLTFNKYYRLNIIFFLLGDTTVIKTDLIHSLCWNYAGFLSQVKYLKNWQCKVNRILLLVKENSNFPQWIQKISMGINSLKMATICYFCAKTLTTSNQLPYHLRLHFLERPLVCQEGCGKWFRCPGDIAFHYKTSHPLIMTNDS